METTVKQRLEQFIKQRKISVRNFETSCGLANGYLRNLRESPTVQKVEKILSTYPELNRTWLLTGEGAMLNTAEQDSEMVAANPYFDNDTIQGGFGSGTGMEQFNRNEAAGYMRVPGVRVSPDIPFIKVKGDSMLDRDNPQRSIPEGSYVALDRVTTTIQWGEVYAVMTDDGPIVKRLYPSDNDGCIRCVSFNSEYPPFELETVKIRGDIYRVIARVIINRY